MVFSDTTNKLGLIQDCELRCGLYDGEISGDSTLLATFTRLINNRQHRGQSIILEASPDIDFDDFNHGDRPSGTFSLSADRAFELPASEKILKLKRVDYSYDGTTYYRAKRFDSLSYEGGMGNEDKEDTNFSSTSPYYDVEGNTLLFYPKPTASSSCYLEWTREVEEFSASGDDTKESGIDEPFHSYLSVGASFDWLLARKPNETFLVSALGNEVQRIENDMRLHYSNKNYDNNLIVQPLQTINDYS